MPLCVPSSPWWCGWNGASVNVRTPTYSRGAWDNRHTTPRTALRAGPRSFRRQAPRLVRCYRFARHHRKWEWSAYVYACVHGLIRVGVSVCAHEWLSKRTFSMHVVAYAGVHRPEWLQRTQSGRCHRCCPMVLPVVFIIERDNIWRARLETPNTLKLCMRERFCPRSHAFAHH